MQDNGSAITGIASFIISMEILSKPVLFLLAIICTILLTSYVLQRKREKESLYSSFKKVLGLTNDGGILSAKVKPILTKY